MGLTPRFTDKDIKYYIQSKIEELEEDIVRVLKTVGVRAVNIARQNGSYQDRTSNLRNSIGYMVLKNGEVVDSLFNNSFGEEYALEIASNTKGFSLIVVAGMNYASYVESRGYDVLASSQLESEVILENLLKQL